MQEVGLIAFDVRATVLPILKGRKLMPMLHVKR